MSGRLKSSDASAPAKVKAGGLLVALAPWPILVEVVERHQGPWTLWGPVPAAVRAHFESRQVGILPDTLLDPMHHHPLPDGIRRPWDRVVVPKLGQVGSSRWPPIRHLLQLDAPLFVASGSGLTPIERDAVPHQDPFTWALDRLAEPPAKPDRGAGGVMCVTADLLGDVLLVLPAVGAFAAREAITMVVRDEYLGWVTILEDSAVSATGITMAPWRPPELRPVNVAVDLTPPDRRSPVTNALVHTTPAIERRTCVARQPEQSAGEMAADLLEVAPAWAAARRRPGGVGLLAACGSSAERHLPSEAWRALTAEVARRTGVRHWVIVGTPAGAQAESLAGALPSAQVAPFPMTPRALLELCDSAAVAVGISTGLTHLTALRGVPTVVVEHPKVTAGLYRVPVAHARYVRSARPWWRPDPSPDDIARALDSREDSYGFAPDEWNQVVGDIGDWLGRGVWI